MTQIRAEHVTFYYGGSHQEIFRDMSFTIDTDWKLGLVGRNGRGKTTLLKLLMGLEEYEGRIVSPEGFLYFPFRTETVPGEMTYETAERIFPEHEHWMLCRELGLLDMDPEVLYRSFETLSQGERTRVLLALLFLKEDHFLLIDEPTNHLDEAGRACVSRYLGRKKGFILVSHDRSFLDGCIDHVMAINRQGIQVVQGNFSSWWEDKRRQDLWELEENERLKKEIGRLSEAARRAERWSEKTEKTKTGTRIGGLKPDRGAIGHKAAKMMKRAKSTERRMENAVKEKSALLKNVETAQQLKLFPLKHDKEVLVRFRDVSLAYGEREVCRNVSFTLTGENRLALAGGNGCGKSTVLKAILLEAERRGGCCVGRPRSAPENGEAEQRALLRVTGGVIELAPALKISVVPQDSSFLRGSLDNYIEETGADPTLFKMLLRKLDFSREHFEKPMEEYSEGQRKKVLLAGSLAARAHLYLWDEPLNYIDVFSRMQLEELLAGTRLPLLYVEHDKIFVEKTASLVYPLDFQYNDKKVNVQVR